MGLWVTAPDLEPGETVVYQSFANVMKGARAIGGQVTITDQRVLFIPNRLDALTGGKRVEIDRRTSLPSASAQLPAYRLRSTTPPARLRSLFETSPP